MSPRDSFDDILDSAIDAMRAGASRDQALASAGGSAATMGGLLDTAQSLATPPRVPAPTRLGDHYDILRAAVERAQMTRGQMIPSDEPVRTPWWGRRLTSTAPPPRSMCSRPESDSSRPGGPTSST